MLGKLHRLAPALLGGGAVLPRGDSEQSSQGGRSALGSGQVARAAQFNSLYPSSSSLRSEIALSNCYQRWGGAIFLSLSGDGLVVPLSLCPALLPTPLQGVTRGHPQ